MTLELCSSAAWDHMPPAAVGPIPDAAGPDRLPLQVPRPDSLKALTLFERRDLIKDSLASWLAAACPEFETVAFSDIDLGESRPAIDRSAAVIFGIADRSLSESALAEKLKIIRSVSRTVPIGLIGDPDMALAERLISQFGLRGYIPTTTTSEVAAAAIRLITAGGIYIPYRHDRPQANTPEQAPGLPFITPEAEGALTLREQTVLKCLRRGLPNKLIAHELGISIGTVKLHVHNVIAKLKVHNRTEAALSAKRHHGGEGTD